MTDQLIQKFHSPNSKVRKIYNSTSRWYDLIVGKKERQLFNRGLKLLSPIRNGFVLEIGCGTGNGLISLEKEFSNPIKIIGVDISEGMLNRSKQKINRINNSNISLHQADARFLPFVDYSFSGIILGFTLELFSDDEIPRVLKECERVLQPKGKIVIVCLALNNSMTVKIYNFFHRLMPNVIDCRPIDLITYTTGFQHYSIDQTKEELWGIPINIFEISIEKSGNL